jgi:hypothetical protein
MTEPLTTGMALKLSVFWVTLVGLLAGTDAGVMIGAFIGAVIFVLEAHEFPVWKRWIFFIFSFVLGALLAEQSAAILTKMLFHVFTVDKIIGAIVAAAVAVKIIILLIARADHIEIPKFPKNGGE